MNAKQLSALAKSLGPVVREYVAGVLIDYAKRLTELEQRPVVHGKDGAPGPEGAPGPAGPQGPQGEPGATGPVGDRGESGTAGEPGGRGDVGPVGPSGPEGIPGRDGLPGVQGPQGEKGLDGRHGDPGRDGANGRDGTLENLKATYDGERTVTFCFKNGDPIEGGVIHLPIPLDRGVYVAGKAYEKGDGVTWGGSFWIAQDATDAKPGDAAAASRAWRLSVKAGRDGKAGPEGKQGPQGLRGDAGEPGRVYR